MSAGEIREEVRRLFASARAEGGFIVTGSHMFQDDSDLGVIGAAYDRAAELAPYA